MYLIKPVNVAIDERNCVTLACQIRINFAK